MRVVTLGTEPILCAHLLRKVDGELVELLRSLSPAEWDLSTVVPLWRVRDVAAHLLDTALRKLSLVRDSWFVEAPSIRSNEDLAALVNRLNGEGVSVYRRLSPAVLIDLMQFACRQSAEFHETLDPFAPAAFAVSWAGERTSLNWFDTARELTERWHHQQQIRLASNRPGGMTGEVCRPVFDCFLRGLPHLYRDVEAAPGTAVIVVDVGEPCGARWILSREAPRWQFVAEIPDGPQSCTRIRISPDVAWRLFTKGCDRDWARARIEIGGDQTLGAKLLELVSVVA